MGLTGPVESSNEDVSEPLYIGSWCIGIFDGRMEPLEDTLVVRELVKKPPNLRDANGPEVKSPGGTVAVGVGEGVDPLVAASGSVLVQSLNPHREAVLGCFE